MRKKLFPALLMTLLLLLTATTALAVSPSDYNCPVCGEPCTEWYPLTSEDGTASCHTPACRSCWAYVWDAMFPCTPDEDTATCSSPALCSVCGYPDTLGSAPNASKHSISDWLYDGPTQHCRYCTECGADHTYEYEDHYGGTATCTERAVCEGCGAAYGMPDTENHDWDPWEGYDGNQHIRTCKRPGCDAEDLGNHSGGDGSCIPMCEVCSWLYLDEDGKHSEMGEWYYASVTQHCRNCLVCGFGWEYADHSGGTATCAMQAICEGCGELYGDPSTQHGTMTQWAYANPEQHYRHCQDCGHNHEYENHYGGSATCSELAVCEGCGNGYGNLADVHPNLSGWETCSETQHYRYCLDCGTYEEYKDHTGGEATCSTRAMCTDCQSLYGVFEENAHEWGDWLPDEDGMHVRLCALNGKHEEYAPCSWGEWKSLSGEYHLRECVECGSRQVAEHTGGTATCTSPRICETCGEGYGTTDNSGLSGHPNPVIEQKPATCYDEGYYRVSCDEPGCSMPFFEIVLPTNGQHIYHHWQPLDDGTHLSGCAFCGTELVVPCTPFTADSFTVCPICGEYDGGVLPVLIAREDDTLPYGTLIVRGGECPADGVLWAFTVAGSYGGRVVAPQHPVTISIPMALDGFRIVGMDGAEIGFTLSEGLMTLEAQEAGLFLLLPAM